MAFMQESSANGCLGIVVVVLLVIAAFFLLQNNARKKAREAYENALQRLKRGPTDPDLREETLRLGRHYSNLTRNSRGVTLFDEVALMNDINAACAAASAPRHDPTRVRSSNQPVEARLDRLLELKAKGLIDEQEYAERRREILREI